VSTFSFAAYEALRLEGSLLPLDVTPMGIRRIGLTRRFPLGPLLGISPFNFPLNLVAHKVAPAIAAGNSIVLKPSSQTPISALILSKIALEAGLPPGGFDVVPCSGQVASAVVSDPRLRMLTFTGSAAVGWDLRARAGKKRVTLELGGNAGTIVEPDSGLDDACRKLAIGAFAFAGQVCISVQRIFVQESIMDEFLDKFLQTVEKEIPCGDPSDPEVLCGPMIDSANAERVEEWIGEAQEYGAKVFKIGERQGNVVPPTVLTHVEPSLRIASHEAFGPVAVIDSYSTFDEAVRKVNDSHYGLQAGVFTRDVEKLMKAFRELEVGGVIHDDTSVFRADPMPYGGVKESGRGREGLRYAIEEMTESKLLVMREG
jgi:glyceraldehyde-3-phosphate dehydrogenase (NADP+)